MKKLLCAVFALVFLVSCTKYAEPDVSELSESLLCGQELEEMTSADITDVGIIFDIDLSLAEEYAVNYSGKGGRADILAVFKLYDKDDASYVAEALEQYREERYNDFLGYAPFEAKKIENGKVLIYGRYVILAILPDIDAAIETADKAFKE